jgi:hypothetical protein
MTPKSKQQICQAFWDDIGFHQLSAR